MAGTLHESISGVKEKDGIAALQSASLDERPKRMVELGPLWPTTLRFTIPSTA
jgi:hypothetical protein